MEISVGFDTDPAAVGVSLYSFDAGKSELFFSAAADTFAEQRVKLSHVLNDHFFVQTAKSVLKMSSPSVSDKQIFVFDPVASKVVMPRDRSLTGLIPLLRVRFVDF